MKIRPVGPDGPTDMEANSRFYAILPALERNSPILLTHCIYAFVQCSQYPVYPYTAFTD